MMKNIIALVICSAIAIMLVFPLQAADEGQAGPADAQKLAGRWLRADGGYTLELTDIKKGGGVAASYYNPRPVKVHEAKWRVNQGRIELFVELRDVNYPGSRYRLEYNPRSDKLIGSYFQAVEGYTYFVEFVRVR